MRQLSAQLAHEHRRIPDAKRRSLALSRLQTSVVNSLDQYSASQEQLCWEVINVRAYGLEPEMLAADVECHEGAVRAS